MASTDLPQAPECLSQPDTPEAASVSPAIRLSDRARRSRDEPFAVSVERFRQSVLREAGKDGTISVSQAFALEHKLNSERLAWLRAMHATPARPPLGVALSGGGVRAASFMCGVLWRLAEGGWLQHVEALSAVSGGSYAAASLATHLAAAGEPPRGMPVDTWYLRVVATFLLRFQRNVSYLVGWRPDVGPCRVPRDGSRAFPWPFDLPLTVGCIIGSLLLSPAMLAMYTAVPVAIWMEHDLGAAMREWFCDPGCPASGQCTEASARWSNSGPRSLLLSRSLEYAYLLAQGGIVTLLLWLVRLLGACPLERGSRRGTWWWPRHTCFLTARALRQLLLRGMAATVLYVTAVWLVVLIEAFNWTSARNTQEPPFAALAGDHLGFTWSEQRQWVQQLCFWYINDHTRGALPHRCSDVDKDKEWYSTGYVQKTYLNKTWVDLLMAHELHRSDPRSPFRNFLKLFGYFNAAGFVCGFVAMAFKFPLLEFMGALAGPLGVTYFVAAVVRWRVFGPITGQYFVPAWSLLPYEEDTSQTLFLVFIAAVIVTLPFYEHLHRNLHVMYSSFMCKAYFADGQDMPLAKVATNPYCPTLILGAAASEYARPEDDVNYGDCMLTPLFMGGERTGCWLMPPWLPLSRAMGISGAAIDAIVSLVDRVKTRFWVGMLNLQMGAWVCTSSWDDRWLLWRLGLHCPHRRALQQIGMGIPMVIILIFINLLFAIGLAFDTQVHPGDCFSRDVIHAAKRAVQVLATASFFVFHPLFSWILRSPLVRHLQLMFQHHFKSDEVPEHVYLSDGGLVECLGLVALLRRRSRWMLVADATACWDDPCKCLRQSIDLALEERLCSFYDPKDERRDLRYAMQDFARDRRLPFLHIGVQYEGNAQEVGDIFYFRMRIPEEDGALQHPLLTEPELLTSHGQSQFQELELSYISQTFTQSQSTRTLAAKSGHIGDALRRDLNGACCFDCCHSLPLPCARSFPEITNINQCLTPLLFANLCRLGHALCGPVMADVEAAMKAAGAGDWRQGTSSTTAAAAAASNH